MNAHRTVLEADLMPLARLAHPAHRLPRPGARVEDPDFGTDARSWS